MTDWEIFRLACLALISGQNPYNIGNGQLVFFNPIWTLIPLIPLSLLPTMAGLILNGVISILSLFFVSKRLNLSKSEFFIWSISPMHLQSMLYGNIEWLPLLGLLLPGPLALIFFCIKPQASLGFIAILFYQEWQKGKWQALLKTTLPTIVLIIANIFIWGLPTIPTSSNPGLRSLFPFSLVLGIPALLLSLRDKDYRTSGIVGPFVSPYVTFHGYLPAMLAFRGKWMLIVLLISFIPVLLGLVK